MNITDVNKITFRQYVNAIRSYREQEESRRREAWEQSRFIAFCAVNPHLKRPMKRVTQLIKFEWEEADHMRKIEFTEEQKKILKKWG